MAGRCCCVQGRKAAAAGTFGPVHRQGTKPDFINEFVHTGTGLISGIPMSTIDWPEAITALEAGRLPCSGGESRLLKITASLAEGIPVNLRDALTGLDSTNINLVASAVLHTGGQK